VYIPGALLLVVLAFCLYKLYIKTGAEHKSGLRRKERLIYEAESVVEKTKNISWDEMDHSQQEMYTCAITRLNVLKSLKPNQTVNENLLPAWPENPNI
jgi:hypothetical protein